MEHTQSVTRELVKRFAGETIELLEKNDQKFEKIGHSFLAGQRIRWNFKSLDKYAKHSECSKIEIVFLNSIRCYWRFW